MDKLTMGAKLSHGLGRGSGAAKKRGFGFGVRVSGLGFRVQGGSMSGCLLCGSFS